ncbi:hypothetical protein BpHYR1_000050 [Brachionus plicatilis]|uniref:Uncharacterized protein n=1 Tax=Brachionus plicatilis TaxID=10195 RepID=A0A3M7REZ5_BRAPC|nr:hypothetical protein BpHYR1_000050 [Brachionus plicatilis]
MTILTKQALSNLVMTSKELTGLNLRVSFATANMKIALISSLITLRLSLDNFYLFPFQTLILLDFSVPLPERTIENERLYVFRFLHTLPTLRKDSRP